MQNYKLPKQFEMLLETLNQVFEIEKKIEKIEEPNSISRNLNRIKNLFQERLPFETEIGLIMENPIRQPYDETRLDVDANISGEGTENLIIVEVIKPIIRLKQGGFNQLVQKGIVIVQSQNN